MSKARIEARQLTAQEEAYAKLRLVYPINPVITAHLSGSVEAVRLQAALNQVQARHPLLSARVLPLEGKADEPSRLTFAFEPSTAIPLRISALDAGPKWEEVVERELCHPFAFAEQPLVRVKLLEGSAKCVLIITVAHVIADGLSMTFILRDILDALNGASLKHKPLPPSAEEILGLPPLAQPLRNEARLARAATELETDKPSFLARSIESDASRRLLDACNARSCTLNGALVAATITSLRERAAQYRDKVVKLIANVDSRAALGVGDECGLYIRTFSMDLLPGVEDDFWAVARKTMSETAAYTDWEAIRSNTEEAQRSLTQGLTAFEAREFLRSEPKDVVVTNLGRMRFGSTFGDLVLKRVSLGVLTGRPCLQVLAAATIDDTISLSLSSRQPVPGLLDGIIDVLASL